MRFIYLLLLVLIPIAISLTSHSFTSFHIVNIPSGLYVAENVSVGEGGLIVIYWSSQPITLLVMTPQQYNAFVSGSPPSAVFYAQAQYFDRAINLSSGNYYVVFLNNVSSGSATVGFYIVSRPAPTGIADYGLLYNGGVLQTYELTFNEIVGQVSFQGTTTGYNANGGPDNFSVQLNAVIEVQTSSGGQELWVQDVAEVSNSSMFFLDNVWNFTARYAPLSGVSGNGQVNQGLYYAYSTPPISLQQSFDLIITVKQTSSNSITISFGYVLPGSPTVWFDNVTVTFSSQVYGAYFEVNGNAFTGSGNAYDAELVLGGPSSGQNFYFTSANVHLNMYYVSDGTVIHPETTYSFGVDTAEGAYDLYTSQQGIVSVGYQYFPFVTTQGSSTPPLTLVSLSYSKQVDSTRPFLYFNLSISGGQPPYYIYLTVKGPGYSNSFSFSYQGNNYRVDLGNVVPGNYTANLTVVDSSGQEVVRVFQFSVVPPPSVTVSANASVASTNQTVEFVASINGGVPPYSSVWYVNGSYAGSGEVLYYEFSRPGLYNVTVVVTDSYGVEAVNWTLINVYPQLSIAIIANYTSVDAGVTDVFYVKVLSGEPPFSFEWYVNGTPVSNSQVLKYEFKEPGLYNVTAVVKAKVGSAIQTIMVRVNPELEVSATLQGKVEQGVPALLTVNITGGTPPYYIRVDNVSEVTYSQGFHYFKLTLNSTGPLTVSVMVSDSGGSNRTISLEINVVPHVEAEVEVPYGTLDLGAEVVLKANVTGGFPPYQYQWFVNGQLVSNSSSVEIEGSNLGNISVFLLVRDSLNVTAYAYKFIEVVPDPRLVKAEVQNVSEVGLGLKFNYTVEYGTPPYKALVLINGTPFNGSVFTSPGVYKVEVIVLDAYNKSVSLTSYVKVYPRLSVNVSLPNPVDEGVDFKVLVLPKGGVPPYSIQVFVNGRPAGHSLVFDAPGSYNVTVVVKDSLGVKQSVTELIKVVQKPELKVMYSTSSGFFMENSSVALTAIVTGGVNPEVMVYLNGVKVSSLAPNSTFFTQLNPGLNNVTVIVVDKYNQTSEFTVLIKTSYNYLHISAVIGVPIAAIAIVAIALRVLRR